jgi:hypothetical protein
VPKVIKMLMVVRVSTFIIGLITLARRGPAKDAG